MKTVKYIMVEDSELMRAANIGEPARCFQEALSYSFMHSPRVFMEVTDRVKFKLDSMGNGKFVSNRLSIVRPKHAKSDANSRAKVRTRASKRPSTKTGSRRTA